MDYLTKCSYGESIIIANELERIYPDFDKDKFIQRTRRSKEVN